MSICVYMYVCMSVYMSGAGSIYKESRWIEVVSCLLNFFDMCCHLYILCLLRHIFLLQIRRNSSRRHKVLMLLSLSSVTNLSLIWDFCVACMLSYRCIQMEWWAAVTVVAIPLQPALLMWLCVSAPRPSELSPWGHRHPQSSPSLPWVLFVTQILHQQLSCILSHNEVRYSCAVERLVYESPFSLLFHKFFWNLKSSFHVPCHRAVTTLGSLLTSTRRLCLLICFQAPVTRSWCLHTPSSADPRLIFFCNLLFYVNFRSL